MEVHGNGGLSATATGSLLSSCHFGDALHRICHAYVTPCASGYNDCDHNESNGCETDVDGDVMNCGDCGAVCKERDGYLTSCRKGE